MQPLLIVKRLNDIVPEKVGDFKRWYLSRAEPGHELSLRYVELNGIVAPHTHYVEETIYYIEGRGVARSGGKRDQHPPGNDACLPSRYGS